MTAEEIAARLADWDALLAEIDASDSVSARSGPATGRRAGAQAALHGADAHEVSAGPGRSGLDALRDVAADIAKRYPAGPTRETRPNLTLVPSDDAA